MSQKAVTDEIAQLASEVNQIEVNDAVQSAKIKDIENVLSTANLNQSAQLSVSGVSPLSLPKNAANGGMSVKLEGLTEDVGGVITHFEPTGRVRSVDKSGLNPTALYLTAPELRSNGEVKDEIRKGANGYELVKRVGVATLSAEKVVNGDFAVSTGWEFSGEGWSISDGKAWCNSTEEAYIRQNGVTTTGAWQKVEATAAHVGGTSSYITGNDGTSTTLSEGVNSFFVRHTGTSPDIVFLGNNYEGTLDDVSIKELVPQDGAISNISTFTELSDETILYTLDTPKIIPISYGGVLNSADNGTVYHEPIIADAGVYETKMDILLTDYPIATIEEIIKHENGIDTYLNVATAVIASDGLSFTHPDLTSGDLVLFTYAYDKESTNGNITATFYDSNVVKIDTGTGTAYIITDVIINGDLTRTLTAV